ncbi:unnamed protein product [Effrenium voratum]|nr:unnamed protein product [Effrenium voratum]
MSPSSVLKTRTKVIKAAGWAEALVLLVALEDEGLEANCFSYSACASACARAARWPWCLQLLADMRFTSIEANCVVYGAVISGCREVWEQALALLSDGFRARCVDVVGFNAAITACSNGAQWQHALGVFDSMLEQTVEMQLISYNAVAAALAASGAPGAWRWAVQVLGQAQGSRLVPDAFTWTGCIGAAGACSEWQVALGLLAKCSGAKEKSEVPWNAAVSACDKGGQWEVALALLRNSRLQRVKTSAITVNAAMSACARCERWALALAMLRELSPRATVISYNAAMSGAPWCHALALLREAKGARLQLTVVTYSTAISACERSGRWLEVLRLLEEMRTRQLPPNAVSYNSALAACGASRQWRQTMLLIDDMLQAGCDSFGGAHYDHMVQAGSAIDCFKHLVLTKLLRNMVRSPEPFTYVDTHAGRGLYELPNGRAAFDFLLSEPEIQAYQQAQQRLQRLADAESQGCWYVGSPLLAHCWLRPQDRSLVFELDCAMYSALQNGAAQLFDNFAAEQANSYWRLLRCDFESFGRGLVLVDPPYEPYQSYLAWNLYLMKHLAAKWPASCVAVWYPCLDAAQQRDLFQRLLDMDLEDVLVLQLRFAATPALQSSGMLLQRGACREDRLQELLQDLGRALGSSRAEVFRVENWAEAWRP